MAQRKRFLGPAAVSAAAIASLIGAPSASADNHVGCVTCGDLPPPGVTFALVKLEDKFEGKDDFVKSAFILSKVGFAFFKSA